MVQDIVIIGGGPAGLAAAIYLARANLRPILFAGFPPGGQLMLTSEIENYPGVNSIVGPQLVATMRKQAEYFGTIVLEHNVSEVKFEKGLHNVKSSEATDEHKNIQAKSVLIATGAKALWLGLESEKKFFGKGVSACATCDGFFFRNKTIAVVGGGDTACEEALYLTKFAQKIYLIHRRDTLRASKIMQDRVLAHEKIFPVWNSTVTEILGTDRVSAIRIKRGSEAEDLEVQGVFIAIGHKPDTALFQDQILSNSEGYILTKDMLARAHFMGDTSHLESPHKHIAGNEYYSTGTNIDGVFAAGDCVDHVYRQAATAAGMGVAASLDVERYLQSGL